MSAVTLELCKQSVQHCIVLCCQARSSKFNLNHALRFHADRYRDSESVVNSWMVGAMFQHFSGEIRNAVSNESWEKINQKYKRGSFDVEMVEKATVRRADLSAKSFRWLAPFGVDVISTDAGSEALLDERQQEVVRRQEEAALQTAQIQMEREVHRWLKWKADLDLWQCSTATARQAFKAAEAESNGKIVQEHLAMKFPMKISENHDGLPRYIRTTADAWAEASPTPVATDETFIVVWINLMVPGSKFEPAARHSLQVAATVISSAPQRACAILVAPNAGGHGDTYGDRVVEQGVKEVEELLKDVDLRVLSKRITLAFNESSVPLNCHREFSHPAWMLVSDTHTPGQRNQLASKFAESPFWKRGGMAQLECLAMKHYFNPAQKMSKGNFDPYKDLSTSIRRKQWCSGSVMMSQIRQRLWTNMGLTSQSRALWVDLLGFCGSLAESILRAPSTAGSELHKMPTEACATCVWAATDLERGMHAAKTNALIGQHIQQSLASELSMLLTKRLYLLDGFVQAEYSADTPKPTLAASGMKALCPTEDGHLAIRQDWVDATIAKLGGANTEAFHNFQKLVAEHNNAHNPSHEAWNDKKRKADEHTLPTDRRALAIEIQPKEGDPTTKDELTASGNDYLCIPCQGHELLFGEDGTLWLWPLSDDVFSDLEMLTMCYGQFSTGPAAEAALLKPGTRKYAMESPSHKVRVESAPSDMNGKPFTNELSTIGEFWLHLTSANVLDTAVDCHSAKTEFEKDAAGGVSTAVLCIKPTMVVAWTAQAKPDGFKENNANAGSRLMCGEHAKNWDWASGMHTLGLICMFDNVNLQQTKRGPTVSPLKPGIFVTKPLRVTASKLIRLA